MIPHAARGAAAMALAAGTALPIPGCEQVHEPDLVVFASADEPVARMIVDRFQAATGARVVLHLDSEATKTVGLAGRIASDAEVGRSVADVFWSSEHVVMDDLARSGALEQLGDAVPRSWPKSLVGGAGAWAGFAGRVRVVVWRTADPPEIPPSMEALGRALRPGTTLAVADPRFGTTRGHVLALAAEVAGRGGAKVWHEWCDTLAATDPLVLGGGNAAVVDAVASGEADLGLTDSDDALAAIAAGRSLSWQPIALIDGDGPCGVGSAFVIPNTVAIVRGAPHPDGAREFVRFMLSAEVEALLAASASGNRPLGGWDKVDGVMPIGQTCIAQPSMVRASLEAAGVEPLEPLLAALRGDRSGG